MLATNHKENPYVGDKRWHVEGQFIGYLFYKRVAHLCDEGITNQNLHDFLRYAVTGNSERAREQINQIDRIIETQKLPFESWQELELKKRICVEILKRRALRKMAISVSHEALVEIDEYHYTHPLDELFEISS